VPTVGLDPVWASTASTNAVTSAAFSPAAGSLIVVDSIADSGSSGIGATISDTASLTWNTIGTVQIGTSGGAAMAWWAYTASAQTNITATVTWSGSGTTSTHAIKVTTYTSTAASSAVVTKAQAASATNNLTVSVTSTNDGCRIAGCAIDWNALGSPTSTDTIAAFHSAGNISGAAVRKAADTTPAGSSVNLNFDAFGSGTPAWAYKVYEIVPAAGSNFTRTVDDPAGLADAAAVVSVFARSQTDLAGLTDQAAAVSAFARAATDTTGLTDTGLIQGRTANGSDDAGLTDSASAVLTPGGPITRTVSDTAGLADQAAAVSAFGRTADDPAGPTDVGASRAVTAQGTDTAGLTDSVSASLNGGGTSFTRSVTDAAGLTDLGDTLAFDISETIVDPTGLVDTASAVLNPTGSNFTRTVDDTSGLSDGAATALSAARAAADTAGLTDSVSASLNLVTAYTRTINDSAGLTSWHRAVETTRRPNLGTTIRPNTGITPRYALVSD
jgi:hypothetical protein